MSSLTVRERKIVDLRNSHNTWSDIAHTFNISPTRAQQLYRKATMTVENGYYLNSTDVKDYLKSVGKTQKDLAYEIGLDPATMCRIINGQKTSKAVFDRVDSIIHDYKIIDLSTVPTKYLMKELKRRLNKK